MSFYLPPANHSIDHGGGTAKSEDPDAQDDQGYHDLDQSKTGGGFHCSPPLVRRHQVQQIPAGVGTSFVRSGLKTDGTERRNGGTAVRWNDGLWGTGGPWRQLDVVLLPFRRTAVQLRRR